MKNKKKQGGFIVSAELVFIVTILVIGLIVGWVAVRDAVVAELGDVAEAIGAVDQSYEYVGVQDIGATGASRAITQGGIFIDLPDNTSPGVAPGNQGDAGDVTPFNFFIPALPE